MNQRTMQSDFDKLCAYFAGDADEATRRNVTEQLEATGSPIRFLIERVRKVSRCFFPDVSKRLDAVTDLAEEQNDPGRKPTPEVRPR